MDTHALTCRISLAHQDLPSEYQPRQNHNNIQFQICIPLRVSGRFVLFLDRDSLLWLVCWAARMWKRMKRGQFPWPAIGKGRLWMELRGQAGLCLNATCELQIRVTLGIAVEETKGTEVVGRRGCGSQITRLCLSILSWLSPAQPGSIDFVWGLERPTASDYLGEWAVLCKQTLRLGLFQSQHGWLAPDKRHASMWESTHTSVHHGPPGVSSWVWVAVFFHLL